MPSAKVTAHSVLLRTRQLAALCVQPVHILLPPSPWSNVSLCDGSAYAYFIPAHIVVTVVRNLDLYLLLCKVVLPLLHGCSSFNTHPSFENFGFGLLVVLGAVQEPSGLRSLVKFVHQSSNRVAICVQLALSSNGFEARLGNPEL